MPLTPEDVRNKRFTPVRLREGYDMGEVDQFLDEVEAELERLTVENEELRAKVAAASTGEPTGLIPAVSPATPASQAAPTPAVQEPVKQETPPPAPEPEPVEEAPAAAPQQPVRASMGDASSAAARLLEIASNNADQLMDSAKEEADRIVGEARAKAERLTNEARGKADRLETDSRIRAQKLDEETNERRQQAVATIERDRYEIQREVEHLRAYEREYRARLKNYFQSQLDQLAANESSTGSQPVQTPAEAGPRRLRSLLGDDESY
ncbi:DivIVA domain-containing protein [Aeromicrobium sp.]|uniref:DivIVA domain-containing protein n=1 Tax=Aeromicrobium sp. TaxID=1871063 RepID=UPI003C631C84